MQTEVLRFVDELVAQRLLLRIGGDHRVVVTQRRVAESIGLDRSPVARRTPTTRPSDTRTSATSQPVRSSPPARRSASASATVSARGSITWSSGTSSASRTAGASPGSSRRASLAAGAAPAARARSASPARARAPRPRRGRARPPACRSPGSPGRAPTPSAARRRTPGYARALASDRRSSGCSFGRASLIGAIIPAATHDAPPPGSRALEHDHAHPRWAARQATAQADDARHRRRPRQMGCCGRAMISLPAPALPGSGSDGRRTRVVRPLSPAR